MKNMQLKRRYRIRRLRGFKNRLRKLLDNLTLSGLYELYGSSRDEKIIKKAQKRIMEMATGYDDLLEIVLNEGDPLRTEAWKKLISGIRSGRIKKTRVRQIFKRVLFVPELRKEAWDLYKRIIPIDERELKEISGFDFISFNPLITYEIEQLLRKRHKKRQDGITKNIKEIQEIIERINKLKKGQE